MVIVIAVLLHKVIDLHRGIPNEEWIFPDVTGFTNDTILYSLETYSQINNKICRNYL